MGEAENANSEFWLPAVGRVGCVCVCACVSQEEGLNRFFNKNVALHWLTVKQ